MTIIQKLYQSIPLLAMGLSVASCVSGPYNSQVHHGAYGPYGAVHAKMEIHYQIELEGTVLEEVEKNGRIQTQPYGGGPAQICLRMALEGAPAIDQCAEVMIQAIPKSRKYAKNIKGSLMQGSFTVNPVQYPMMGIPHLTLQLRWPDARYADLVRKGTDHFDDVIRTEEDDVVHVNVAGSYKGFKFLLPLKKNPNVRLGKKLTELQDALAKNDPKKEKNTDSKSKGSLSQDSSSKRASSTGKAAQGKI